MGRYYAYKKATVEDCLSVSVYFLKKHKYFASSFACGSITWLKNGNKLGSVAFSVNTVQKYVEFHYSQTEEQKERSYRVGLETTNCNFGGVRYWFICPFCYSRVATLHLYGGNDFACRCCLKLSYESRNRNSRCRGLHKLFDYDDVQEEIAGLKTKYYKGKLTRKYSKLLRKVDFLRRRIGGF